MENREKFEIPTIAFTEVELLTTASSTCGAGPGCDEQVDGADEMLVNQNL